MRQGARGKAAHLRELLYCIFPFQIEVTTGEIPPLCLYTAVPLLPVPNREVWMHIYSSFSVARSGISSIPLPLKELVYVNLDVIEVSIVKFPHHSLKAS
jgi:hypothetical protein